jgi:intein-encoded DNA endonuclease-like protein
MNNLCIPVNISSELMPSFLRGYFDGDGSIWKTKSGKTFRFLAAYTGGERMMMDIQKILSTLGISTRLSYRYGKSNKNSCSITVGSHDGVCALGKYLYNDASVFLKRKHVLFCECQEHVHQSNAFYLKSNGSEEKIKTLYIGGKTQKVISDELHIPFSTVRCCVQRLRKNGVVV